MGFDHSSGYVSLFVYAAGVFLTVGVMLGLSYLLGQRHADPQTGDPYESGILTTGSARVRYYSRFYLIAIIFVVFDLESVFIVAWALVARELGWSAYGGIVVFIAVLVAAFAYVWRTGGLETGALPGRNRPIRRLEGPGGTHR